MFTGKMLRFRMKRLRILSQLKPQEEQLSIGYEGHDLGDGFVHERSEKDFWIKDFDQVSERHHTWFLELEKKCASILKSLLGKKQFARF